jgi:hypothetical protein
MLLSLAASAQNVQLGSTKDSLPSNFLLGKHIRFSNVAPGGPHAAKKNTLSAATRSLNASNSTCPPESTKLACVDTLTNFVGYFNAPGIYLNGQPRSAWEYSMVGTAPHTNQTTTFNAPVIPVTISMLNADGSPRFVVTDSSNCPRCKPNQLGKRVRLLSSPQPFVNKFMAGPVFGTSNYTSSPVPTQFTDAVQRAEFGNRALPNWHTLLSPSLKKAETMALIEGTYYFSLNDNGTCCRYVLVSDSVFSGELFPPSTPDTSTIIGTAEVNGDIMTKDISTFFFPNVYLYSNGNPNDCCVLGYHSFDFEGGDASNGNRVRFYVMNYSSWISPGLFADPTCSTTDPENCFQDVTAHSHEIAEIFNDPFVGYDNVHNITPFWQNPAGQCQDIMEVGDVIEDLLNPTYPVTIGGFSYHPQTEALLPWFAFKSPSFAIHNAYSYPNETVLTSLSAPQPYNCGR